jgi:hypothetical protein
MKLLSTFMLMCALLTLFWAAPSRAQLKCESGFKSNGVTCVPDTGRGGLASTTSVQDLLVKVISFLLLLAGGLAVLFVIIGGFRYLTSGGNEEAAKKGKKTLIYALAGIAIVVLSYAIVNVIVSQLGKIK